jgi:penicillin-binding protein 2
MGIDGLIKMVETFDYDKRTGIDLPNEKISQTPKYWKPLIEKREGKWSDIRTVYSSIGQDTVVVTPIAMLRAISSVGVEGRMYTPHLLKEFRQIEAIGEFPVRLAHGFDHPEPKIIEMTKDQENLILKGMWGVVNAGGTAGSLKMAGWEIAGKTGTAQVASLGLDKGHLKDHSWFMSFAPAYKPEIAVIGLIENSGFGAANAGIAVKGVHEAYVGKYHPDLLAAPTTQVAKNKDNYH